MKFLTEKLFAHLVRNSSRQQKHKSNRRVRKSRQGTQQSLVVLFLFGRLMNTAAENSFNSHGTQSVVENGSTSDSQFISYGVLQGSLIGP